MKSAQAELINCGLVDREDGEKYHELVLHFQLHTEDMRLARLIVEWLNGKHASPEVDTADFFLACITHEIHQQTEKMTGKKFVLRMDRKERKA